MIKDKVANVVSTTTIGNVVEPVGTIIDSHDEPHVEPFGEPYVDPHTKPIDEETIDTLVFNTYMYNILNENHESSEDLRDEVPQNEEFEVLGERNEEVNEDGDVLIADIIKRIIKNVTKYRDKDSQEKAKEVVHVDEETETGEEPIVIGMKSVIRLWLIG